MSSLEVILAGSAPDTGNLGVSALCYSTVVNLRDHSSNIKINVLGHGERNQIKPYFVNDEPVADIISAKHTKRIYDPSSFYNIRYSLKFGNFASRSAKIFKRSKALLDISGGDSFTDLYGKRRFSAIVLPKLIAIENKIPLILLPQTYGPFKSSTKEEAIARNVIRNSTISYARDKYSFEYLKDLLGSEFDDRLHKQGVDVAFLLPKSDIEKVRQKNLLPNRRPGIEVFGINVSGLIYNEPENAAKQYGIKVDYHALLKRFIEYILGNSDGDVWLVPHVLAPYDHFESDSFACKTLKSNFNEKIQQRIKTVSGEYDQCEIKSIISECDWFTGTRMHSTIASLSTQVPTAAIAYSGKTKGVFASAGQESKVFDARLDTTDELLEKLIASWHARQQTKLELERDIPILKQRAHAQFSEIVDKIPW